jgi:hypothetical protein
MGQVFRARDTKLDRDVAIKILQTTRHRRESHSSSIGRLPCGRNDLQAVNRSATLIMLPVCASVVPSSASLQRRKSAGPHRAPGPQPAMTLG